MVQAISASVRLGQAYGAPASAGLEAQLARFQKILAECVNCDSAKTAAGKAQIQAISEKISVLRERMEQAGEAGNQRQPPQPVSAGAPAASSPGLGGMVDVFA